MARITLSLLGPFQLRLDGIPVSHWKSKKVQALLAYLAVEDGRPHHRDSLAAMLWPDQPDRAARDNLRYALYHLRQTINDHHSQTPLVSAGTQTLQMNGRDQLELDVTVFERLLDADPAEAEQCDHCRQAVDLYRGPFLEDFAVAGCPDFQDWLLLRRQRYGRRMALTLECLVQRHARQGRYEPAEEFARQWLALEPWNEHAHRVLMRLLAQGGRRGDALVHFSTSRQLLADELGLEPAPRTLALVEAIRAGTYEKPPD
ncbi:MAG TPA: BTAD domain-containing putative transcriptional regulator [Anaerolineae bacterium]|jgi:DNA-binding SARP family transcriptional activator|nr:BTAD domain-containing putative transcriptional regulator [Anaerolineae bacterium]